jgi:hypothetical protein
MTRPNKEEAWNICDRLMKLTWELRDQLGQRDAEGRTLSLGVTMFMGAFMSAIDVEGRELMCDAAQGYAITMRGALDHREAQR